MTLFPEYLRGLDNYLTTRQFLGGEHPSEKDSVYIQDFLLMDRTKLAEYYPHINEWVTRLENLVHQKEIEYQPMDMRRRHVREIEFTDITIDTTGESLDTYFHQQASTLFSNEGVG